MKANMNPRTGTKIIKKYTVRNKTRPFCGTENGIPFCVIMQLSELSVCLSVHPSVCLMSGRVLRGRGGLWVVSVYTQNKCDKHSTVLQI